MSINVLGVDMTIVLYAESREEYEELSLNNRYNGFENEHEKVIVKYQKKKLGRPRKKEVK